MNIVSSSILQRVRLMLSSSGTASPLSSTSLLSLLSLLVLHSSASSSTLVLIFSSNKLLKRKQPKIIVRKILTFIYGHDVMDSFTLFIIYKLCLL